MFLDGSFFFFFFFLKEFCKQFNIHLLIRSQRPKTTGIATDRKFYLPDGFTNGESSLPVAITARIGQSECLPMSKPDSCEIISKSDQQFLRRFF